MVLLLALAGVVSLGPRPSDVRPGEFVGRHYEEAAPPILRLAPPQRGNGAVGEQGTLALTQVVQALSRNYRLVRSPTRSPDFRFATAASRSSRM
jgi:hypothetical protein